MSAVLLALTTVLALGKQTLVTRLRRSAAHVNRISGVILVAAGVFIVWFWTTELRAGASALGSSPAFRFVENLSQGVLNLVADHTLLVALGIVAVLAIAAGVVWLGRDSSGTAMAGDEKVAVRAGDR